jgi:hypothetical protein
VGRPAALSLSKSKAIMSIGESPQAGTRVKWSSAVEPVSVGAANSRRETVWTVALDMIGPMPGTVINRSHAGSCLSRQSNRSLSASPIPTGKRFSEGRDWAGIFGHGGPFHATETGIARVSFAKAPES